MSYLYKQLSLKERAAQYANLIREPGWELLQRAFRPDIRTRITDRDGKETLLYEAIRAQLIQEIFATPLLVMQQAEREWAQSARSTTPHDELIDTNSL